jgi:phosphatidylglycerol:prolipoprotein diacylglycerol transferase
MHPTLFTIGKWNVPTYSVLLYLGLILALVVTYYEGKRMLGDGEIALDLGLWTLVGGILGGRIAHVATHWSAYSESLGRVIRFWDGGLYFHGAFLGGMLALFLFSRVHRRYAEEYPRDFSLSIVFKLGDVLALGLALGLAFGWAACMMGGCAYGVIGEGVGHAILPDTFGVEAPRFASQAVGLVYAVILLVAFWLMRERWPFAGGSFLMYVLLYFAGLFFLEFTLGSESIYLGPWRVTQVIDLVLILLAAVGLLALWWQARSAADVNDRGEELGSSEQGGQGSELRAAERQPLPAGK